MLALNIRGKNIDLHNSNKINHEDSFSVHTGIVKSNYAQLVVVWLIRQIELTADWDKDKQHIDPGVEDSRT